MANFSSDNATLLAAALEGLELQRQRIDAQIAQVRAALGKKAGRATASAAPSLNGPKRNLSESARKRIAAAQKKRWAEYRKNKASGG